MHFHGLNLNLLVAFDALYLERHLARAGARLHLSQPAMSSALARLRDYFKDDLFVVVDRQLAPTPRAQAIAPAVCNVLAQVQASIIDQPEFDAAQAQRAFSLVVSDYISLVLMPAVLPTLRSAAPGVGLDLLPVSSESPSGLLEKNQADLILVPEAGLASNHPFQPVLEEHYQVVVARAHPLARCASISVDDYLASAHAVVRFGSDRTPGFDGEALARLGVQRRVSLTTANLSSLPWLVQGTDLVATVHTRLAQQYQTLGLPIAVLPLPFDLPPLKLAMQWHRLKDADPGLRWLREILVGHAARL